MPGLDRLAACLVVFLTGCSAASPAEKTVDTPDLTPDFVLTKEQTHDKFSRLIEPAVRVPSGRVIEAFTHELAAGK